jgi:hypothetical protein
MEDIDADIQHLRRPFDLVDVTGMIRRRQACSLRSQRPVELAAVLLGAMTRTRLVAARSRGAPAAASGRSERTSLNWNLCVGLLTHGIAASR